MTPQYGDRKQVFYRDTLSTEIFIRYGLKTIGVLTLGGAYCLENPYSIENTTLVNNKNAQLTIVEKDTESCNRIIKSLKNVNVYDIGHGCTVYEGDYRIAKNVFKITVAKATLSQWFKVCVGAMISYKVFALDYFTTLNYEVESDLDLVLGYKLIDSDGSIFLTAADPRRAWTQPTCMRILNTDPNKNKQYETGLRYFMKKKVLSHGYGLKTSPYSWDYSNSDQNSKKMKMYVVDVQLR